MDPLTHAASGAVGMLVLRNRPATFWAAPLAALACASPDIDLAFIHTPLEFLELHRGITHSFAFMPFFALALACLCWPLWRKTTPFAWKFHQVWLFCCAMILLHIWLDVVTTYGTMVFLPFSHYRVRLNSLYIIELAITVPLLWAIIGWRKRRALLLAVLVWTFLFPAAGIGINAWHTKQCQERFVAEGRQVERLHVLPDAFAPLFWRVIYEEQTESGPIVASQSLNFLGEPREPADIHQGAPRLLAQQFMTHSIAGDAFFHFAMLPVNETLPTEFMPEEIQPDMTYKMFYDLRFGSGLKFVRDLLALRPNADLPFLFMAELAQQPNPGEADRIHRIRLRFSDSGRDSQWHIPEKPAPPTIFQWLVGLR